MLSEEVYRRLKKRPLTNGVRSCIDQGGKGSRVECDSREITLKSPVTFYCFDFMVLFNVNDPGQNIRLNPCSTWRVSGEVRVEGGKDEILFTIL